MVDSVHNRAVGILQSLNLTAEHLEVLKRQGYVARESRGRNGQYFKLRFRFHGRQVVRYLGSDPELASRVATELQELQKCRRLNLELSRVMAEAARMLRTTKAARRTALAERGFSFHGYQIRRTRSTRKGSTPAANAHLKDLVGYIMEEEIE